MPRQRLLPYGDFDELAVLNRAALEAVEARYVEAVEARYVARKDAVPRPDASKHRVKFNALIRALINLATIPFSADTQMETSAPSKATVKKIERLLKLTVSLKKDFPREEDAPSISGHKNFLAYAMQTKEQWEMFALPFWLEYLAEMLEKNELTLKCVLSRLASETGFTKGDSWDLWVYTLRQILNDADLPTEVRRDGLGISPFVAFVDEMQNQLPDTLKRLMKKRSSEALATAITRATDEFDQGWADVPVETLVKIQHGAIKPLFDGSDEVKFYSIPDLAKPIDDLLNRARSMSL
jgi:hypothetical protein